MAHYEVYVQSTQICQIYQMIKELTFHYSIVSRIVIFIDTVYGVYMPLLMLAPRDLGDFSKQLVAI